MRTPRGRKGFFVGNLSLGGLLPTHCVGCGVLVVQRQQRQGFVVGALTDASHFGSKEQGERESEETNTTMQATTLFGSKAAPFWQDQLEQQEGEEGEEDYEDNDSEEDDQLQQQLDQVVVEPSTNHPFRHPFPPHDDDDHDNPDDDNDDILFWDQGGPLVWEAPRDHHPHAHHHDPVIGNHAHAPAPPAPQADPSWWVIQRAWAASLETGRLRLDQVALRRTSLDYLVHCMAAVPPTARPHHLSLCHVTLVTDNDTDDNDNDTELWLAHLVQDFPDAWTSIHLQDSSSNPRWSHHQNILETLLHAMTSLTQLQTLHLQGVDLRKRPERQRRLIGSASQCLWDFTEQCRRRQQQQQQQETYQTHPPCHGGGDGHHQSHRHSYHTITSPASRASRALNRLLVQHHATLQRLELDSCPLHDADVARVAQGVSALTQLQHVAVHNCGLDLDRLECLVQHLPRPLSSSWHHCPCNKDGKDSNCSIRDSESDNDDDDETSVSSSTPSSSSSSSSCCGSSRASAGPATSGTLKRVTIYDNQLTGRVLGTLARLLQQQPQLEQLQVAFWGSDNHHTINNNDCSSGRSVRTTTLPSTVYHSPHEEQLDHEEWIHALQHHSGLHQVHVFCRNTGAAQVVQWLQAFDLNCAAWHEFHFGVFSCTKPPRPQNQPQPLCRRPMTLELKYGVVSGPHVEELDALFRGIAQLQTLEQLTLNQCQFYSPRLGTALQCLLGPRAQPQKQDDNDDDDNDDDTLPMERHYGLIAVRLQSCRFLAEPFVDLVEGLTGVSSRSTSRPPSILGNTTPPPRVETLSLTACRLDDDMLSLLVSSFLLVRTNPTTNGSITTNNQDGEKVGENQQSFETLGCGRLKHLDLSWNHLTTDSLPPLTRLIRHCPALEWLNLSHNEILFSNEEDSTNTSTEEEEDDQDDQEEEDDATNASNVSAAAAVVVEQSPRPHHDDDDIPSATRPSQWESPVRVVSEFLEAVTQHDGLRVLDIIACGLPISTGIDLLKTWEGRRPVSSSFTTTTTCRPDTHNSKRENVAQGLYLGFASMEQQHRRHVRARRNGDTPSEQGAMELFCGARAGYPRILFSLLESMQGMNHVKRVEFCGADLRGTKSGQALYEWIQETSAQRTDGPSELVIHGTEAPPLDRAMLQPLSLGLREYGACLHTLRLGGCNLRDDTFDLLATHLSAVSCTCRLQTLFLRCNLLSIQSLPILAHVLIRQEDLSNLDLASNEMLFSCNTHDLNHHDKSELLSLVRPFARALASHAGLRRLCLNHCGMQQPLVLQQLCRALEGRTNGDHIPSPSAWCGSQLRELDLGENPITLESDSFDDALDDDTGASSHVRIRKSHHPGNFIFDMPSPSSREQDRTKPANTTTRSNRGCGWWLSLAHWTTVQRLILPRRLRSDPNWHSVFLPAMFANTSLCRVEYSCGPRTMVVTRHEQDEHDPLQDDDEGYGSSSFYQRQRLGELERQRQRHADHPTGDEEDDEEGNASATDATIASIVKRNALLELGWHQSMLRTQRHAAASSSSSSSVLWEETLDSNNKNATNQPLLQGQDCQRFHPQERQEPQRHGPPTPCTTNQEAAASSTAVPWCHVLERLASHDQGDATPLFAVLRLQQATEWAVS